VEVPSEIGPYLIESVLRVGGTSIVYRAVDPVLGRHVAIKRLHPRLEDDPTAVARFRREAIFAAKLKNPNIVVIHEAKVDPPPPYYIAMEFLEGGSLADRLGEGRRLPVADVLSVTRQVSEGLEHAHRQGLVHCDIKPGNIMFHADGRIAITDFGISRVVDQATTPLTAGRSGTLEYMSPEQVRGEELDHRSDVYSLGVVVYQMLTGRTPFRGTEPLVVMRQILDDAPPAPRSLDPEIPVRAEAVLLQALAKDRARRPRDAMSFCWELARAYRGRTEWWRKVALAAVLLAAAVMIGLVASRIQKRTAPPPISPPPAVINTPDLKLEQGIGMYSDEKAEGSLGPAPAARPAERSGSPSKAEPAAPGTALATKAEPAAPKPVIKPKQVKRAKQGPRRARANGGRTSGTPKEPGGGNNARTGSRRADGKPPVDRY